MNYSYDDGILSVNDEKGWFQQFHSGNYVVKDASQLVIFYIVKYTEFSLCWRS